MTFFIKIETLICFVGIIDIIVGSIFDKKRDQKKIKSKYFYSLLYLILYFIIY